MPVFAAQWRGVQPFSSLPLSWPPLWSRASVSSVLRVCTAVSITVALSRPAPHASARSTPFRSAALKLSVSISSSVDSSMCTRAGFVQARSMYLLRMKTSHWSLGASGSGLLVVSRFSSQIELATALPTAVRYSIRKGSILSIFKLRTWLMCTPRERWNPLQLRQTRMPRLRDTHTGSGPWQSAQTLFPSTALSVFKSLSFCSSSAVGSLAGPAPEVWLLSWWEIAFWMTASHPSTSFLHSACSRIGWLPALITSNRNRSFPSTLSRTVHSRTGRTWRGEEWMFRNPSLSSTHTRAKCGVRT
mmetsp:Transcript_49591/g.97233  ORF Transcript_49591/g.97233 Transcript_49591/m.97233 type:complete len:302 (-) Transcript_49591:1033-1938(-)